MRRFVFDAHLSIHSKNGNISSVVSIMFLADLPSSPRAQMGLELATTLINPDLSPEVVNLSVSEIPYDRSTPIRG